MFELAQLKRVQFGVKIEWLNAQQRALFDEAVAADITALLSAFESAAQGAWLNDRLPRFS